jgi:phosphoglycolate phosphatase-like HAD superfamily hydrolase
MRQQSEGRRVISRDHYDGVLFDLDGVITNTAKLHAALACTECVERFCFSWEIAY